MPNNILLFGDFFLKKKKKNVILHKKNIFTNKNSVFLVNQIFKKIKNALCHAKSSSSPCKSYAGFVCL